VTFFAQHLKIPAGNLDFIKGTVENIDTLVKVTIIVDGKKKKVTAPGLIKRRSEESAPFRVLPTANATN